MVAETAPSGAVFVCCWRSEFVAEPGSKRRLHNSSTGFLLNVRFTRKWSFSLGLYNQLLNGNLRPKPVIPDYPGKVSKVLDAFIQSGYVNDNLIA